MSYVYLQALPGVRNPLLFSDLENARLESSCGCLGYDRSYTSYTRLDGTTFVRVCVSCVPHLSERIWNLNPVPEPDAEHVRTFRKRHELSKAIEDLLGPPSFRKSSRLLIWHYGAYATLRLDLDHSRVKTIQTFVYEGDNFSLALVNLRQAHDALQLLERSYVRAWWVNPNN